MKKATTISSKKELTKLSTELYVNNCGKIQSSDNTKDKYLPKQFNIGPHHSHKTSPSPSNIFIRLLGEHQPVNHATSSTFFLSPYYYYENTCNYPSQLLTDRTQIMLRFDDQCLTTIYYDIREIGFYLCFLIF